MVQEKQDLNFRKIRLIDAPTFSKWRKDEQLGYQVGWDIDPKKWNLRNEQDWIRRALLDRGSNFWACILGDEVIGRVGVYHVNLAKKSGEISILIGNPKYRGGGIGKSILKFAVEQGYNELALSKIYATIFEDNDGAIRFFEASGFKKSGSVDQMRFRGQKRTFLYFDHIK